MSLICKSAPSDQWPEEEVIRLHTPHSSRTLLYATSKEWSLFLLWNRLLSPAWVVGSEGRQGQGAALGWPVSLVLVTFFPVFLFSRL